MVWNLEENEFLLDGTPVKDDWAIPFSTDFVEPMKSSESIESAESIDSMDSIESNEEVNFDFLNSTIMDFFNQEMVLRFYEGKVYFSTDLEKFRRSCNATKVKLMEQLLKKKVCDRVLVCCSRSVRRFSSEWTRIFVS